jgi:hypothetical protein
MFQQQQQQRLVPFFERLFQHFWNFSTIFDSLISVKVRLHPFQKQVISAEIFKYLLFNNSIY